MTTKRLGDRGEEAAALYLEKRGCRILERQFRMKTGEIDIIAEEDGTLLFIEVKTRHPTRFGTPAQAVGRTKQRRIFRTAFLYMQKHGFMERACRFDVIEILVMDESYAVRHYENAFEFDDI